MAEYLFLIVGLGIVAAMLWDRISSFSAGMASWFMHLATSKKTSSHGSSATGSSGKHDDHGKAPMKLLDLTLRWVIGAAVVFALMFGTFWLARIDRQDSYDAKAREEDRKADRDLEWRASMSQFCGTDANPNCVCFGSERPARVLRPREEVRLDGKGRGVTFNPGPESGFLELCDLRGKHCTTEAGGNMRTGVTILVRNLKDEDLSVECTYE